MKNRPDITINISIKVRGIFPSWIFENDDRTIEEVVDLKMKVKKLNQKNQTQIVGF